LIEKYSVRKTMLAVMRTVEKIRVESENLKFLYTATKEATDSMSRMVDMKRRRASMIRSKLMPSKAG
jgi:hypothetical protein